MLAQEDCEYTRPASRGAVREAAEGGRPREFQWRGRLGTRTILVAILGVRFGGEWVTGRVEVERFGQPQGGID